MADMDNRRVESGADTDRAPITFRIRRVEDPQAQERAEQRAMRHEFMVPVYICMSTDVPLAAARAAVRGVQEAVAASGQEREIHLFRNDWAPPGPHNGPNWYIEEAARRWGTRESRGHGPQVDVENVMRLLYQDPHQKRPHWDVVVTNVDLHMGAGTNFVFGAADYSFPVSVQSVRRFVDTIRDPAVLDAAIARLLRHEVGHMLGLPNRDHHVEDKLGLHCTNVCTMRQGMSVPEWTRKAVEEHNAGVGFCECCKDDLARKLATVKPL